MCMCLFGVAGASGVLWTIRMIKPKLFLIDNEAALYHTHNPLNYNLTKLQGFLLCSFSLFSLLTALFCLLVLLEASKVQGDSSF